MDSLDPRLNGISWEHIIELDVLCPHCRESNLSHQPFTDQIAFCPKCDHKFSETQLWMTSRNEGKTEYLEDDKIKIRKF